VIAVDELASTKCYSSAWCIGIQCKAVSGCVFRSTVFAWTHLHLVKRGEVNFIVTLLRYISLLLLLLLLLLFLFLNKLSKNKDDQWNDHFWRAIEQYGV